MKATTIELFHRLCRIGNALEDLRATTYRHGALWLQLDAVLTALDVVIDTLAEPQEDGTPARRVAGEVDVLPRPRSRDSQERPSTSGGGAHTP